MNSRLPACCCLLPFVAASLPALTGRAAKLERPQPLYWRLQMAPNAKIAMRVDDWKMLADAGLTEFELYHLKTDPHETTDLQSAEPERFAALREQLLRHHAAVTYAVVPGHTPSIAVRPKARKNAS